MDDQTIPSRRQFLAVVSAGITATLAGCSGGDDNDTDGPSEESEDGPEAVLEAFFTAVDSGDVDEANSYYLEEAGSDDRPIEQRSVDIHSIENHSIEEAADNASSLTQGSDVSADELEEFGNQFADQFDRSDSEWTVVYFNVEIDGAREENYSWLVRTESDWKIGLLALLGA